MATTYVTDPISDGGLSDILNNPAATNYLGTAAGQVTGKLGTGSLAPNAAYNNGGATGVNFLSQSPLENLFKPLTDLVGGTDQAKNDAAGVLSTTFWTDIFLRAIIVILGFVFVAAGLSLFKNNSNDALGAVAATVKNVLPK